MKTITKTWFTLTALLVLAQAVPAFAQERQTTGWRKIGDTQTASAAPNLAPAPPPTTVEGPAPPAGFDQDPQAGPQNGPPPGPPPAYQQPSAGPEITVPAGTWITVRVNQPLSSDHNQPGDAFTATLAQPLIAQGFVIARRGQTVAGRVAEAEKAGHVKGTSRLSIELTELSLVDGQQLPIRTQLAERRGSTSTGRDAGAIAAGTGVGAAIGAAADGGFGAGVGALAGAAASTIGVLATRGNQTVVYPEMLLTFRLEAPVHISTARSEQAFQPVTQDSFDRQPQYSNRDQQPQQRGAYGPYYQQPYPYYGYGYSYGYGYGYPGYYAPYFGSSLFFYSTPRYYYGRGGYGYRGGGYRGGGYRHR